MQIPVVEAPVGTCKYQARTALVRGPPFLAGVAIRDSLTLLLSLWTFFFAKLSIK